MVYLQAAIYGYFLYSFTPSVTLLGDDEHVSRAIAGLHGTGLAVGAMVVGVVTPRLTARFGRLRMMWVALAVLCVGVGVFVSCRIVAVTIAGAVIAGLGGTLVVNLAAAILTAHQRGAAGGAAVTQANGFGSALGIFAPLLVSAAIAIRWGWRAGVLVTVVAAAVVALAFGRSVGDEDMGHDMQDGHRDGRRMSRAFWWAWAVLVMTTAIEFSMTIWSSDVLAHHDGLAKGTAATGVTAIVAGMTIARLCSGRLTLRYSVDRLLLCAFGTTLFGFGVFWSTTLPWLAYVGLFTTGLGISLQFPLAITRVIGFSDGRADLATGYGSIGTGLSIGLAPFGLGAFADQVGSHTAMLVVPIFVLVAAAGVIITRRTPRPARPDVVPVAIGDVPGVIG
jgi:MFS family permease